MTVTAEHLAATYADVTLYQTVIRAGARPMRDARAIHRQVEYHTHPTRTLWATPEPRTLIIRTTQAVSWADWPGAIQAHTRETPSRYPSGSRIVFSLIANATRALHPGVDEHGRRLGTGKRVGVESEDRAVAWLERRLGDALEMQDVRCQRIAPVRGGRGLLMTRWAYSGTATVTDTAGLTQHLVEGVGRGKAFGCGLLLAREEQPT